MVGDLLVLIPKDLSNFLAYVIPEGEDIDDIQAALGVEIFEGWAVYDARAKPEPLAPDVCIDKRFREFAARLTAFPPGSEFSTAARDALFACVRGFGTRSPDDKLLDLMKEEYRLFRLVERQICAPEVQRLFQNIDDFLRVAATIMNRRKARAGRSMEHHVEYILRDAGIPFDCRPDIAGEPDIIIPGKAEYNNASFPVDKLFMLAVKTTCRDRWRQILNEAGRIPQKHLLTIQEGISRKQLLQMQRAQVSLIVPDRLHSRYPKDKTVKLLNVEGFIELVRRRLAG